MCAIVAPMRAAQAPTHSPTTAMDRTRPTDLAPSPRPQTPFASVAHTPCAAHPSSLPAPAPRRTTSAAHPSSPRAPDPRRTTSAARLPWFALALALACTPQPESNAPPSQAPTPSVTPTRTANNDARGAGMQPDYAGEAEALRQQIAPRLPDPLPSERRTACTAMLDAAASFYGDIESEPASRTRLLADLAATRTADLAQCEQTTSVRAATCVQLRLADRDAELPWLLDQCTRAFPD